jgi:hypothetical protein
MNKINPIYTLDFAMRFHSCASDCNIAIRCIDKTHRNRGAKFGEPMDLKED